MGQTLTLSVWRGAADGAYQTFEVPWRENQTVLDAVTYVQRTLDPTLSYRFACRVGMCGSCAMTVNGVARWTCRTHVNKVVQNGQVEIAPLHNLPVIKDLVADLAPFFDKWVAAGGRFAGEEGSEASATGRGDGANGTEGFAQVAPDDADRRAASAGIECIGCAICYASCDVVAWNPAYLGPAALNRAWTLVNDVRDTERAERLDAVTSERGCLSCHSLQSCTERCPMHLDPAGSIAGLKRLAAKRAFGGGP